MKRVAPLAFAFTLLALACNTADADPTVSESRKVPAFSAIEIAGMLAVEARVDATAKVEVIGDADLVRQVSTTVKNGVLVLDTPRDFGKNRKSNGKLRIVIATPDLTRVSISGVGALEVEGIRGKSFVASISGTGALALKGQTEQLRLDVAGSGEVKAKKLQANIVELAVPGTAKASVYAARSFDARVDGTAVVKVHGKPASVKKTIHGVAMIDV